MLISRTKTFLTRDVTELHYSKFQLVELMDTGISLF